MMRKVTPECFLIDEDETPIVDVRSPSEYEEGHISGAVNIPLFSDEERAHVGTSYKREGRQQAILEGLGIVRPKLDSYVIDAKRVASNNQLRVHCWRGGMRSEYMASLFELAGMQCTLLEGGYKSYRNFILDTFKGLDHLILIQGRTGSGKTDILQHLRIKGEQVVDLEGLANHKGSAFGALGMGEQPSTLQFQNDIFNTIKDFDLDRRIWMESESMTIGRVYLPETLWHTMNRSTILEVVLEEKHRVERLVRQYAVFNPSELEYCIRKISQRLGDENMNKALELLAKKDFYEGAELLLKYYDKGYRFSAKKYKSKPVASIELSGNDPGYHAHQLIQKANDLNL